MLDLESARRGPLAPYRPQRGPVRLQVLPAAVQLVFRGGAEAADLAGQAFGVELPREACRSAIAGVRAALWLGPDEWLLRDEAGDAVSLTQSLAQAMAGAAHALVDVSHRQGAIEVAGVGAARALNTGCPLDLDRAAFPVGMCTRTVFGKAEILLWRVAETRFQVQCWRSFAAYVHLLLDEARRELEV